MPDSVERLQPLNCQSTASTYIIVLVALLVVQVSTAATATRDIFFDNCVRATSSGNVAQLRHSSMKRRVRSCDEKVRTGVVYCMYGRITADLFVIQSLHVLC